MQENNQNSKVVVGLDIGTTKICAIVGCLNQYGKLEILGMGQSPSHGVVRGMVQNIDKAVLAIQKAVKEAEDNANVDIKSVNVGIAGQHIRSSQKFGSLTREYAGEVITPEEIDKMTKDMYFLVTEPGNDIIHAMPQHYTIDGVEEITEPVGCEGARIEGAYHVITAHTGALNKIYKSIKRAGLEVNDLILEPLASSLSVLDDEEKEAGVVLIDIGGGTTDVAIFKDNVIQHTAVLPFGGEIITSDIKEGCNILHNDAEALKLKFGLAIADEAKENVIITIKGLKGRPPKEISMKNLACIIEARVDEIIEYVHSEIVRSGFADGMSGGIVLTGGGSMLQFLVQRFEYKTGMHCRVGHPNEHLGKGKVGDIKNPKYATSIGLVLSGFEGNGLIENMSSSTSNSTISVKTDSNQEEGKANMFGNFSKSISNTVKGFLAHDIDDNSSY